MAKGLIGIALIILAGYGLIEARHMIAGPSFSIDIPVDYTSYEDGVVNVSGVARNTEAVILNGGPLLMNEEGRFSTTLVLPKGGGILSLTATDRFGRTHSETRTIYVP
jgi:Glucodextranase, domain B